MTKPLTRYGWKSATIFSVMLGAMMGGVCALAMKLESRDRER